MNHNFLIAAEEREHVSNLISAIAALSGKTAHNMIDLVVVTTNDDQLAAILDQALPGKAITMELPFLGSEPKKPEKKTRRSPVKNNPHKKGHRACLHCHNVFENEGNEKLCPTCKAAKETAPKQKEAAGYTPWKIVGTDKHLTSGEISEALSKKTLEIGCGLSHPARGTFVVVDNGKRLGLEKIME